MSKVRQELLGLVAPSRTRGQVRFARETIRRGGPFEVQGFKWKRRKPLASPEATAGYVDAHVLKKMPR